VQFTNSPQTEANYRFEEVIGMLLIGSVVGGLALLIMYAGFSL
jgi:hypothetical protein